MQRLKINLLAALVVLAISGCHSKAQEPQENQEPQEAQIVQSQADKGFNLINLTDKEWVSVTMGVSGMEQQQVLGKNEKLYRGDKYNVTPPQALNANNLYEITCTDAKGEALTFTELDLYNIKSLTITIDKNLQPLAIPEYKAGYEQQEATEATTYEEATTEGEEAPTDTN